MNGRRPKCIFTDQAQAIGNAIEEVFPETHHYLCLWHIYQNAAKHLSHVFENFKDFTRDFKDCIYEKETEEEFQSSWNELLSKYNLKDNSWLHGLYQLRKKWAQVYMRKHFCAGMTTTQRSEGMNKFLKKYFKRTLSLREFVAQYDKALVSRREKERLQDFASKQKKPNLPTNWPGEAQALERYTTKIFLNFQKQYLHTLDMFAEVDDGNETISTYTVSSFVGRSRTVIFDSTNYMVKCSCKMFEFMGILCAHPLKVIHDKRLSEIPLQYYLRRWTKDGKDGVVTDNIGDLMQIDCQPSKTVDYSELAHMALTIAVKGTSTKNSIAFTKALLGKTLHTLDNFLKSDLDNTQSIEKLNQDTSGGVSADIANITIRDPPRKKASGRATGRIKGSIEKQKRKKSNTKKATRILQSSGTQFDLNIPAEEAGGTNT